MTEPFSDDRHIEHRSLVQEDDLLDFREDMESVVRDAEASLVRFESGAGHVDALDHFVFLSNRLRSSAEVIGLPWVARVSMMMEDVARKVHAGGRVETAGALTETLYAGLDAIRRYVDALVEDRLDEEESVANSVRAIYIAMEAQRKRLGQKDVDSLLGELGL